jgi:hypothetical protein
MAFLWYGETESFNKFRQGHSTPARLEEKLTKIKEKVVHQSFINRSLTHETVLLILASIKQLSREKSSCETDQKWG